MSRIILSIVICTHNREHLAHDAVASVLEQDFPHDLYELLIVDNASTDHTRGMAQKLCEAHSNVRYIFESNLGLSHARNRGWLEASGEYVGYLDDDAKASAQWLSIAYTIATNIRPDAFGGPYYAFYNVPKPKWYKDEYGSHVQDVISRPLHEGEYLVGGNMFIHREALRALDGFNSVLGMQGKRIGYGEETYFFNRLRMIKQTAVLYYDPSMFIYHLVRPEKLTLRGTPTRFFLSGFYHTKLVGFKGQRKGLKFLLLVMRTIFSIFSISITLFKSCTWDLLKRNRNAYPFYQNYLYETTMTYCSHLGVQTQFLLQCLGIIDI
jgi:glycosyltransferase involved in cell wall biosynthesis